MIPKLIISILGLVMILAAFSPLNLCILYLVARPLVQPWAMEGMKLILGIPLTAVFPLILIGGALINSALRSGYRVLIANIIPMYLFLFVGSISIINSLSLTASIGEILKIGAGIAMYLLVYNSVRSVADAQRLLFWVTFMSVIPMILGFRQYILRGMGNTRVTSIFVEANAYGEFLGIAFCCALMLLNLIEGKKRVFVISVLGAIVVSMILSRNRGQWIALGVALLFSYVAYRNRIRLKTYLVPAILIAVVFSGAFVQRFEELDETQPWGGSQNTFEGRTRTWAAAMGLVPAHFLIGYGAGTADLVMERYFGHRSMPHNDYVKVLLENGSLGVFCYILFLAGVLLSCVRMIGKIEYWYINYSLLILVIFWIILSTAQNMLSNVAVFPFFMAIVALAKRINLFSQPKLSGGGEQLV